MKKFLAYLFVAALALTASKAASADKFCEMASDAGKKPERVFLVLVDPSTGSLDQVGKTLARGLLRLYDELGEFDEVIVRRADSNLSSGSTVFDRCMPACPDPSIWDKLGIGSCDTMQVRKGKSAFKSDLTSSAISLLSENQSIRSSDLVSTLMSIQKNYGQVSKIILFSELQHVGPSLAPRTPDDYDELFFQVVTENRVPDLSGRALAVFGYGMTPNVDPEEIRNRRLFWDQLFSLSGFDQVRVGQTYQ